MSTPSEHTLAHLRSAAFDEFMSDYRRRNWLYYQNPAVTNEQRAAMDESARLVFYAGFNAGVDSKAVSALFVRPNT